MKCSDKGIEEIKKSESFREKAYVCAGGKQTIGYGSTRWFDGKPVEPNQICTKQEAEELLRRDLKEIEDFLNNEARQMDNGETFVLPQGTFDGLCSYTYNLGIPFVRKSTLLKNLKAGKYLDKEIKEGYVPKNR